MAPKHILIAEDEENTRLCLNLMLKSSGFRVSEAENGIQALDKLLECHDAGDPADLLITDIRMPELNGIQLIRRICQLELDLPVIVITGFGDKDMLVELIRLGVEDYLEKPFGNEDVCRKIDGLFEKRSQSRKKFERSYNASLKKKARMERELRDSVSRKEFVLHYQPIIDLEANEVVGIEALLRWLHPKRGIVPPMDFIPLAEETGLIVPIGTWVLRKACQQIAAYTRNMPRSMPFMLGINVSVKQLLKGNAFSEIRSIIRETGIQPECVGLEITESTMIRDADSVLPLFEKLKKWGVRLAIDDFGTGYSSLSYLHRFPFDTLKIDRSFVGQLGGSGGKSAKIVQAIISLASDLGMNVIAEGIEDESQIRHLKELNCRCGQGFYFSKPMELEQIKHLLLPSKDNERINIPKSPLPVPAYGGLSMMNFCN